MGGPRPTYALSCVNWLVYLSETADAMDSRPVVGSAAMSDDQLSADRLTEWTEAVRRARKLRPTDAQLRAALGEASVGAGLSADDLEMIEEELADEL